MKSIVFAAILFTPGVWAADEAVDRAGIELTIRAFSMNPARPGLFTSDFDPAELDRLRKSDAAIGVAVQGVPGEVVISKEPMGEAVWLPAGMHTPLIIKKTRFLTGDVAIVDVAGKSPLLVVMRKVGTDWKIASLRILSEN